MNTKQTSNKLFKIRLKKGDLVQVLSGKYKGKQGKIVATHASDNKVTVEGINIVKKHMKPNRTHPQGGIVEITKPIWVSKVSSAIQQIGSRILIMARQNYGLTTSLHFPIFAPSGNKKEAVPPQHYLSPNQIKPNYSYFIFVLVSQR